MGTERTNLPRIFVVFILVLCCCYSMPPNIDIFEKLKDRLEEGKGLYLDSDHVTILNATNFKSTIFDTDNAWVVEFYNSWCGHCFVFAPKWKALAADVYNWNKVLRVAAIDCAADENNPICRDYDIMGYPTLKFFPANAPITAEGTEVPLKDIGSAAPAEIKRVLIGILRKEQLEGRGAHWPNITPLRSSDIESLQTESKHHYFIIFEHPDSSLGTELILDFSLVDQLEMRTVTSDNEALARFFGVILFPAVVYIPQGKTDFETLHPTEQTREGFRKAIGAFLSAKGVVLPKEVPIPDPTVGDIPDLQQIRHDHELRKNLKKIKAKGDVVFLADIETALRYMLGHEIPNRKVIRGEALAALKKFLTIVAKYFPAGDAGIKYFETLKQNVNAVDGELRGLRFKAMLKGADGDLNSVLATQDGYLGCAGSKPHLRGYTCGVWNLFHYFTVSGLRSTDSMEVLSAMLGYVKHFFGCTECSQHFQAMANRSMAAKATDPEKAMLWLWSAHNEVNARLAKTVTDDPLFPKIQYPSQKLCGKCRDASGKWIEANVLDYLHNKYHQDSINYEGANNQVHVGKPVAPAPSTRRLEATVEEKEPTSAGRYFNSLDISICIALYVVSGLICAAAFWKFVLRRHYRRKAF